MNKSMLMAVMVAAMGLSACHGPEVIAVPVAVYRNRLRSVPDRLEAGRHGDAAFADWLLLVGYSRRFGEGSGGSTSGLARACPSE